MLPGRTYSPEDIADILRRRAWLILVLLVLGTGAAVAVAKYLPDQYRSETLIMLLPQRIPESYVKSTVTSTIEDRLATLSDQILSRSRLERIILDLNLYEPLRRVLPMEDVVQRMRGDITIRIETKGSFRISYVSRDAKTAQKTTERLASLFIEENLRDRENVAENTNQFLDAQLDDAKRRLIEHEKRLEDYRSRYSGELPSQAAANFQAIQSAQGQLQNLADASDRARERRLLLERQLVDLQPDQLSALSATTVSTNVVQDGLPVGSTAEQLQAAQARLQILLTHAKPDHPDVRAMQRTIRDLETQLEAERSRPAEGDTAAKNAPTPAEALRQKRARDLKAEIDDIDRQLSDKQEQDRRLRAMIAEYQAKLDAVPKHESELVELTRDYTTLQTTYQSLLTKLEESKIAANLERSRNIGEQFKILDPARVPQRPFSPNRSLIYLGGTGGGLALAVLLIGLLEYRDSSLKCEEDVVRLFDLPVLALVPLMVSAADVRERRNRSIFVGSAVVVLIGSAVALALWKLQP